MLDLDKKVGNRVCANTRAGGRTIALDKIVSSEPYSVKIPTGCTKEPKKGKRFCETCLAEFALTDKEKGDVIFLQSLHPVASLKRKKKYEAEGKRVGSGEE